jgi:2,4-dienoyl-CoA reductase-like NADH-dependent reductase (Old Yellow Enzyme family)
MTDLFTPLEAGDIHAPNRIWMSPLTRGRADADGVPSKIIIDYYQLRADAGLIISEATSISKQGHGWLNAPGIYTEEQETGWRAVTDAVHQSQGRMVLQLWHMGRVSHPDFLNGALPFAPSAIASEGETHTPFGKRAYVVPHAMSVAEIRATVADYRQAAHRAINAGFDGVEIHGANGYLIDEFLRECSNARTDTYGGSVENRARFLREVVEAVTGEVGSGRVALRLSLTNRRQGMKPDADPLPLATHVAQMLNDYHLAYLHVVEGLPGHFMAPPEGCPRVAPVFRKEFNGVLVLNGGYDKASASATVAKGEADAITFGRPFIANPDFVRRLRENAPLNAPDPDTFYTPGEEGYLDYPRLPGI